MQNASFKHYKIYRKKASIDAEKEYISGIHNINESLEHLSISSSSAMAVNSLRSRIKASISITKPHINSILRSLSPYSNRALMQYIQSKPRISDSIDLQPVLHENVIASRKSLPLKSHSITKKEAPHVTKRTIIIAAPSLADIYGRRYKIQQRRRLTRLADNKDAPNM